MLKIRKFLLSASATVTLLSISSTAFAATIQTNFNGAFSTIFNVAVVIASVIFVILLLVGGIQYLTSGGNEESSTAAKKMLVNAVIGLVIVFIAYAAGNFIVEQLFGSNNDIPAIGVY